MIVRVGVRSPGGLSSSSTLFLLDRFADPDNTLTEEIERLRHSASDDHVVNGVGRVGSGGAVTALQMHRT